MDFKPANRSEARREENRSRSMPRCRVLPVFAPFLFIVGVLMAQPLFAQNAAAPAAPQGSKQNLAGVEKQILALEKEVRELRQEVGSLKQQLQSQASAAPAHGANPAPAPASANVRGGLPAPVGAAPQAAPSTAALADSVSMLQSQVAEQAQTKVESNSRMPVKIFGTILLNTFYNSRGVDWWDIPSTVTSPKNYPSSSGSLSASLRQTRVGAMVEGPTLGTFRSSAFVSVDFLGGGLDFQSSPVFGVPRLYYGYVRFDSPRTSLEMGQDAMILAPENPTSLAAFAYPEFFRAGNLYSEAPQIRVEQKLASLEHGSLKLALGMVAPVGGYPSLDYPGAGQYEPWQRPAIQGRIYWLSKSKELDPAQGWEMGLSGHYGHVKLGTTSAASWAAAFDLDGHVHRFGVAAEGYLGQNLESFGGGIGQPGKTIGGFLEGRYQATPQLQFDAGLGSDHLTKFDIVPVPLNRNTAVFANTIYKFTPEVAISLEYRHMVTRPFQGIPWKNENLNLALAYKF